MMNDSTITVGLLSHYFKDTNLGCTALSICDVLMLDRAAAQVGKRIEYKILVNEKQPQIELDFTDSLYEYRVFPSTKKTLKNPIRLLTTKVFDDCDVVFNLCAGDGFTDIYGKWRTFSESYMVLVGHKKGYRMVLAPQTIGPFTDPMCKRLAHKMMDCCSNIFVRDSMSYNLCCEMGQKNKTMEVIDVALALPFEKKSHGNGNHVGINVSGLLYNDASNKFSLNINYRDVTHQMVEILLNRGYTVHLIPHVIIPGEQGEDDYAACKAVHQKYPMTILAPKFDSPIAAKGYIAGLQLFIGARMHSTIAAISSDVPVIPIAYSRKVNGLYGNLKYPFYLDTKEQGMSDAKMIEAFNEYLLRVSDMKSALSVSKEIYKEALKNYENALRSILMDA